MKKEIGYKGTGMCKACAFSKKLTDNDKHLYCGWYASECKLVSRNCTGIKLLK